jgi:tetratricopeptide (TPR) repeat protein
MESKMLILSVAFTATAVLALVSGCDKMSGASKQEPKSSQSAQQTSSPQQGVNAQEIVTKAQAELSSKNYGQAVETARTAVNAEPKNAKALFVFAEAQGANGDVFGALKSLDDALKNGYDNKNAIYSSEYLEKARASAGFRELMTKYGLAQTKTAKKSAKGTTYKSDDSISAGDVKINMKEVFKDDK